MKKETISIMVVVHRRFYVQPLGKGAFMSKSKKGKNPVILIVGLLLMFVLGRFIPTWGPVTRIGVQGICIFIGLVLMAASGYPYIAISVFAILAIQLSGALTFPDMIASSLGGTMIFQLIVIYGLCRALIDCGAGDVIARWLISRKFAKGKPFAFTFMLMIASVFAGAFIGLGGLVFYYSVLESIRKELGYDENSSWMKFNVFGVYAEAMIGMSMLPFKGLPLLIFSPLKQALGESGIQTSDLLFMGIIALLGIIIAIVYYFIMVLFKVDLSKLKDLDITKLEGMDNVKMDTRQAFVTIVFAISLLYTILILFIKKGTPFGDAFNGITQAGWFSICLAIMCLVKIDGKPAANPYTVLKDGVDWNVIYAMIGFTQAGAVLTMDEAGIKLWLQDSLSGIFVNFGFPLFLLLVLLISWILTNFLSNTAVGVIMASLASPFLTVHIQQSGINPTVYAAGFMISVMFAFATQAACGAAPLLFGNKCISDDLKWLYSKGMFAGIIIFVVNYLLTLALCYIL